MNNSIYVNILNYMHDFKTGIRNLIKWFRVIWKDRDYDHSFIYEILRFKLEKQAYYLYHRNKFVSTQRDVEKMLLCSRLCMIQQEDLYDSEYLEYFDFEISSSPSPTNPGCYEMDTVIISENLDEYLSKYPRKHKMAIEGKLDLFIRPADPIELKKAYAMEIAHYNQQQSKEILFKLLNQNIQRWWD